MSRQRYVLLSILFFHSVNTYMDRACIASAADYIIEELKISTEMWGLILGIFAIGYALFQIPSGWIADRFGPRKALTIVVSVWSCFTALTGAARSAIQMLVLRFLFGVGEAGAFPGGPVGPAGMTAFAPYAIENVQSIAYDVCVNRPKVAAYRAPGAPLSEYAVECAIDELAQTLGIDPIELRLKNAATDNTQSSYGPKFNRIGYVDTLEAVKNHPHYSAPLGPNQGRGVASGFWFNIGGESSATVVQPDARPQIRDRHGSVHGRRWPVFQVGLSRGERSRPGGSG